MPTRNLTSTLTNTTVSFDGDLTEMQYERCITSIKLSNQELTADKLYWPVFKVWFEKTFKDELPYFDFNTIFDAKSVDGAKPLLFGKIIHLSITKFFTEQVYEEFTEYTGVEFFLELNDKLSNGDALTDIMLIKKIFNNIDKDLDVIAKELTIVGYYLPDLKKSLGQIFISTLPDNEVVKFLKYLNCFKKEEKSKLSTIEVKKLFFDYKNFKKENDPNWSTNEEVHFNQVGKKKKDLKQIGRAHV